MPRSASSTDNDGRGAKTVTAMAEIKDRRSESTFLGSSLLPKLRAGDALLPATCFLTAAFLSAADA
ncbi:hypothetical protein HPP92_023865 [Vanilla planifolia]|uniref:Uncharacterized protein n=1 Tax=Vanilla planifolia TaxID=51239 RepID=A0A835PR43_VANPL|nr:hypothetical protein HPP92_023865 [Vanilla planifolia]